MAYAVPLTFNELLKNGLSSLNPFKSPPPLLKPSPVVYEKLPPYSPVNQHLITGLALGIVGMFLMNSTQWLRYWGIVIVGFIAPVLYYLWLYKSDKFEREPLGVVIFLLGWGIFCGIFVLHLNTYVAIPLMGLPGAAFTEEAIKAVGIYWIARHKRLGKEFNDHMDGMVYGAVAGVGFAGLENYRYLYFNVVNGAFPLLKTSLIRSITAVGHIIWTGLIGRVLGVAKVRRGYLVPLDFLAAVPVGIILHFLWNAATPLISVFYLFPIYIFIFYRNVVAAQKDEEIWGYKIRAPIEEK
jgi:RsiW-degrading membrane proteinase PrsW (M82 family)